MQLSCSFVVSEDFMLHTVRVGYVWGLKMFIDYIICIELTGGGGQQNFWLLDGP